MDSTFPTRTLFLTSLAMIAFAANSLLCRMALRTDLIDPATFASVRVIAGALTLTVIALPKWRIRGRSPANWRTVLALFFYLAFFSFAYLSLSAGTGALILFGAVQLTMFTVALKQGESFPPLSWAGLLLAFGGLVYLVSPGLTAPDPFGAALMAIAGISWGFYSLWGKGVSDPLEGTANNFIFATPLAVLVSAVSFVDFHASAEGLLLAIGSGAISSGLGYVIWYAALRGLSGAQAATVQLSVPVIAAFGGVILLSEEVTLRLVAASAATLGGVAIVLAQRALRISRA